MITAETQAGSSRRKRMNEGGSLAVGASANYEDMDDFKMNSETNYVNTGPPEESHTRSLLKGFTWRCLATVTTVVIAWFVTGEIAQAFQIGLVEFFAKLAIYYLHERAWAKIRI